MPRPWPPTAPKRVTNAAQYNATQHNAPQFSIPGPSAAGPSAAGSTARAGVEGGMSPKTKAMFERNQKKFAALIEKKGTKAEELIARWEAEAAKELDTRNPLTREHHERMKRSWATIICLLAPPPIVEIANHWTTDTVRKYAKMYLRCRVEMTTGREGDQVKAITVAGWVSHLIYCIAYFTYDAETQRPSGRELLRQGLYKELEDTLKDIIVSNRLDRHSDVRFISYGKNEFQLAVEYAICGSQKTGRMVKIQTVVAIYLSFASGIRPSGLAAPHSEIRDMGRYMLLEDVQVFRRERGVWDVRVDFKHHKGYNTAITGMSAVHNYRALNRVHNLTFDPVWIVAYLYARGAFKYKTLDELIDSEDAELKIIKPKEPFFLKAEPGGRSFTEPPTPALAKSISDAVSNVLKGAGLKGSMYAFRRGAGNELDVKLGSQKASLILGHADASSMLSRHYSMTTANLDILGIHLGEATELLQPGVEESLRLNRRLSGAIVLVATRLAVGRESESESTEDASAGEDLSSKAAKASKAEKAALDARIKAAQTAAEAESKIIRRIKEDIDKDWLEYIAPLGVGTEEYKHAYGHVRKKQNLGLINKRKTFKLALQNDPKLEADIKLVKERLDKSYEILGKEIRKLHIHISKPMKDQAAAEKQNVADTSNDRDQAVAHFEKPSKLLDVPVESTQNVEQMKAAIAAMNHEENVTSGQLLAQSSLSVLNFNLKSVCGGGKDPDHTLDNILAPAANQDLSSVQNSAMDQDMYADGAPLDSYDDCDEQELIKDLPTPQARCVLLRYILAPILIERAFEQQLKEGGGKALCHKCKLYPGRKQVSFGDRGHWDRHMAIHTHWYDLELRMPYNEELGYGCPAAKCDTYHESIGRVREHCLSGECVEQAGFIAMQKEHDLLADQRQPRSVDYVRREQRDAERVANAQRLLALDREDIIEHGKLYGYPEDEIEELADEMLKIVHETGRWNLD